MEEKEKKRTLICITGGICTGKTSVLNILEGLGATVFSCDSEIKKIKESDEEVKLKLEGLFPGFADNKNIAEEFFGDRNKLSLLEDAIYPALRRNLQRFIETCNNNFVFVEVPLLYEKGMEKGYDKVIVTTCSYETQKQRAVKRGLSVVLFKKILERQLSSKEKESKGDYLIDSDASFEEVKARVFDIYSEILKKK